MFAAESNSVTELFEQHHAALHRYLVRYTGDAELAADIAQETFVRYLERPPRAPVAAPWLFRVATNLARDAARKSKRRRHLVLTGRAMMSHSDPPDTPDRSVDQTEARETLRDALQALSEKERMALLMREEGFTHREIADALDTTTGSIGTLLARAIRKAAKQLGYVEEAV